ncbi:YceI family protein [Vitreimonas flagellata]|uniref:YceI family protein n=1 Tax=Vitreimonas flagellata TaxID=2560861 RepID=UPI00107541D3|nr:YceI family protein [Vitreimonas flagellata]
MRALLIASLLALSSCVSVDGSATSPAASVQNAAPTAAAATYPISIDLPAGSYRLDPRHASVLFRIRHEELSWFTARFDTRDATLEFDPTDPSRSRLTASVDATTVNTGLLNPQGERAFDRSIGRAIGAEATPQISFASTAIERTGEHTARVTGDLTMNGQTHPATLDAVFGGGRTDPLRGNAVVLGFSAHGEIRRSEWGVTQWSTFTGDVVQLVIEAELIKG